MHLNDHHCKCSHLKQNFLLIYITKILYFSTVLNYLLMLQEQTEQDYHNIDQTVIHKLKSHAVYTRKWLIKLAYGRKCSYLLVTKYKLYNFKSSSTKASSFKSSYFLLLTLCKKIVSILQVKIFSYVTQHRTTIKQKYTTYSWRSIIKF